jgi:hypothetical protein
MTPDDTPVPGDDAIARAARDGLHHLAGSRAPADLDWESVRSGARRVRQRRLAALLAAGAIVLTAGGIAVAATNNRGDHVSIAGHDGTPTTTTTDVPTSTSPPQLPTTTAARGAIGPAPDTSTQTTNPLPVAQPSDLMGTISLAGTTLVAGQPTTVGVTLRNVSDHTITLTRSWDTWPGIYIDFFDNAGLEGVDLNAPLAAGQERTFTATITPRPEIVGTARIFAAYIRGVVMDVGGYVDATLEGVPSVTVTILPPGWTPGEPLEPSQGKWKAEISADAAPVVAGDPLTLHVMLTNVDDVPHKTEGYGLLGVRCSGRRGDNGAFLDPATLAPGATQSFSVTYTPGDYQIGPLECSLGMAFSPDPAGVYPRDSIQTNVATLTVLPAGSTPTASTSTTPTTSP